MLGSILVPNGSFESHVSTNGRVYVGQDFMMYNPTAIGYESTGAGWEGKTASVLNMDQERHNLPWNGQMIANCPAIQWNKANSAGEALEGTTWKVYGTLEAAKAGTPSLGTITDGEFTDGNDDDGIIKFEGIERNAKYFVKEFATNSTEYTRSIRISTKSTLVTMKTPTRRSCMCSILRATKLPAPMRTRS